MIGAELCAGYGGLGLALDIAGIDHQTGWFAEIDDHAAAVMARHHPTATNVGDLTQITWRTLADMDLSKHHATAERRFALYQSGKSLAEVAEAEGVTRQTVFMQFKRRGWDLRPRPTPKPTIEFNGHKYTMRDAIGYYGRTAGGRTLLHRDVWQAHHGAIPDGHDVHHIDHDRTNNDISNLEIMTKADHTRRHAAEARKAGEPGDPTVDIVTAGFP